MCGRINHVSDNCTGGAAHAKETPDKLAIGFKKIRVTYRELGIQVRAFAQKLQQEFGIEKGDFIMISAVSKPEYIVGISGSAYLGGSGRFRLISRQAGEYSGCL